MDKFSVSDSYRQGRETVAYKIDEAKDKLIRVSEHNVLSELRKKSGGVKLLASATDLKQVEGATSSSIVFDGYITVNALLNDKKVAYTLKVVKSEFADAITPESIDSTIAAGEVIASEESTYVDPIEKVEADLAQFSLVDTGTDYLSVFHAANGSERLTVIGKEEYASIDKEAVLRNALLDTLAFDHVAVEFTGTFVEPTIQAEGAGPYKGWNIQTDPNQLAETRFKATHPTHKPDPAIEGNYPEGVRGLIDDFEAGTGPWAKKEEAHPAATEIPGEADGTPVENSFHAASLADGFRQEQEFTAQKSDADYERLSNRIANELVALLRSLQFGNVKIISSDLSDRSSLKFTAALMDSVGEKVIQMAVPVDANLGYNLPKKEAVLSVTAKTTDLRSLIGEEMQRETLKKIAAIEANEAFDAIEVEAALKDEPAIEKTAAEAGGMQYVGPVDVLNMDRDILGLPHDTKEGAIVYADGFKWELVSKDFNNLGKEANSGRIWTFRKVVTDKKPDHVIPQ